MRRALVAAGVVAGSLLAGAASAQQSAPRTHDGFYLRLGAGFGGVGGNATPDGGGPSTRVKGGNFAGELAFGGTIAPGLVIGGGVYSMIVPSPKYTDDAGNETTAGAHHIAGFGPFLDWYFDPAKGGHLQGGLLLATGVVSQKDSLQSAKGFGGGLMIGGGYEFWVADQWSIGPLARIAFYRLGMKNDDVDVKYTLGVVNVSVLFGATYH